MAKSKNFKRSKRKAAVTKTPPRRSTTGLFLLLLGKSSLAVLLAPFRRVAKLIFLVLSLWLGLGAVSFGISFSLYQNSYQQRVLERKSIEANYNLWRQILISHPTSREALLGARDAALSLGYDEEANMYREQLLRVDPNDTRVGE